MTCAGPGFMPLSVAIKIQDIASYNANPSMLTVAPIGIIKRMTDGWMPHRVRHCIDTGTAIELRKE